MQNPSCSISQCIHRFQGLGHGHLSWAGTLSCLHSEVPCLGYTVAESKFTPKSKFVCLHSPRSQPLTINFNLISGRSSKSYSWSVNNQCKYSQHRNNNTDINLTDLHVLLGNRRELIRWFVLSVDIWLTFFTRIPESICLSLGDLMNKEPLGEQVTTEEVDRKGF